MTDTDTATLEPEVTAESVLALARDFDAGKDIDATPPVATEAPKVEPEAKAKEPVAKDVSDSKESKAKEPESTQADKPKSKWAQNEERKARTWQEINAEKEAIKAEREALLREKETLQQAKVATESLRDEHGATAKDYREAAKRFAANGQKEMAQAAEQAASELEGKETQMRQQRAVEQGRTKWMQNLENLAKKHPDLTKSDSELHKATLRVLEQFPLLKNDPDGINYAVRAAEIEIQAKEFEGTKAEFTKLKAEYDKLQKKLTISSGSPTSPVPEIASFEELSHAEQGKALEQAVRAYDRESGF